jgi:ABC-type transporter Mla subunit MlaD
MTLEDFALRFEGIDPAKVNEIANNLTHLLGVVDGQMERVKEILIKVDALSAVVQAELPRAKQTLADIQSQIAAYEANQRRFNR